MMKKHWLVTIAAATITTTTVHLLYQLHKMGSQIILAALGFCLQEMDYNR